MSTSRLVRITTEDASSLNYLAIHDPELQRRFLDAWRRASRVTPEPVVPSPHSATVPGSMTFTTLRTRD